MGIICNEIYRNNHTGSWAQGRSKRSVLTHFMSIGMYYFRTSELLWCTKNYFWKERTTFDTGTAQEVFSQQHNIQHFYVPAQQLKLINNCPIQTSMLSNKQIQSHELNKKLDEVKDYVFQLLSDRIRVQKEANNPQMTITVKSQQNKYAKKGELEKENMVLVYEVKLLANLIARLGISEDDQIFTLNSSLCNTEIKARENSRQLQLKVQRLESEIKKLQKENEQLHRKLEIQSKATKIWQKKCNQYEKLGGTQKLHKHKQSIKQLSQKNNALSQENIANKEQIKKLKQKCVILEQLNKETDQKLSQMMIANINSKSNKTCKLDKENKQENREQKSNAKVQLLAAKEEIKMLKMKIGNLEKLKIDQKIKYEEKESIYEKMVMKSLRN